MGISGGRAVFGSFPKENRICLCNGGGWKHATSDRRSPRTKWAVRRAQQAEEEVGVGVGGGSGDRPKKEIAVVVADVQSVLPYVFFADESLGELGAKLKGETMGRLVVGVDVRSRRSEERRRFEKGDLVEGNVFVQVGKYVCLYLSGLVRCLLSSVFSLSCVICERVDDDNVVVVECSMFYSLVCLWEGVSRV